MTEVVSSLRVRLPCKDRNELAQYAPSLAAKGVVAGVPKLKPIGTVLRIKLELATGVVAISGEAVVARHVRAGEKLGLLLHLTRLDPTSFQFPLAARPAPSNPELPAASQPAPFLASFPSSPSGPSGPSTPSAPSTRSTPSTPSSPSPRGAAPESSALKGLDEAVLFADTSPHLLELNRPPPAATVAPPPVAIAPPAGPDTPSLSRGEPEPVDELDFEPAPDPAPSRKRGRVIGGVVAVAAVLAVGLGAYLMRGGTEPDPVALSLAKADERIAAGRLVGPSGDEALDHLIRARALRADDPRVVQRLKALGDKFEELGDRALARGDKAEAAAHLQAAVTAEPQRSSAAQKLKDIEEQVRAQSKGVARPSP
ncbi:MAG: hypothetical protein QM765_35525 [Myxococcales bacterium]